MSLERYLEAKGAEYASFDPARFRNFYEKHKNSIRCGSRIVQIVGTNGKGTTGRFLAGILKNAGYRVGHFTSPHILSVNERFWLDGADASMNELEISHSELAEKFGSYLDELSYFEYLTLLCITFFRDKCDFLVLEAGLGGEFDSTSVVEKELMLLTNIGLDHQEMLGNSLEEIVNTKMRASNCPTIVGFQSEKAVNEIIKRNFPASNIRFLQDIASQEYKERAREYISRNGYASYLTDNLILAMAGADFLGVKKISLDGLAPIFGRFERIAENITIDVGHNPLAAQMIAKELGGKKVVLVYNSFVDKNPQESLFALKNNVKIVEILELEHPRIIKKEELTKILDKIGLSYRDFGKVEVEEEYLVFGSFSVVCEFLRRRVEAELKKPDGTV